MSRGEKDTQASEVRRQPSQDTATHDVNLNLAQACVKENGGELDKTIPPYKAFDVSKHERFLIQKGSLEGRPVVFKVGDSSSEDQIKKEARYLQILAEAARGVEPSHSLNFPHLVKKLISKERVSGIATEFIKDDLELKHALSDTQKMDVFRQVISGLQSLPIPPDVIARREVPVLDQAAIQRETVKSVEELASARAIDATLREKILQFSEAMAPLLAREVPVFCHGDVQAENFFIKKEDGHLNATLLDIEGLEISNRFLDWAYLANHRDVIRGIRETHPEVYERIRSNVQERWYDIEPLKDDDTLLRNARMDAPADQASLKFMCVFELLHSLSDLLKRKDSLQGISLIKKQQYEKMLKRLISPAEQSSRAYEASSLIKSVGVTEPIRDLRFGSDVAVGIIGDGQGMDTRQLLEAGVAPGHLSSVNYEDREVEAANEGILRESLTKMKRADATDWESLEGAGWQEGTKDILVMLHVLEVPTMKGEKEKQLVSNLARALKPGGEALITQYASRLSREQAERLGVEEIRMEDLMMRYGAGWERRFYEETGSRWEAGMRYSDISRIRTKEELLKLFSPLFDVRIDEKDYEFVLRLKRKSAH